MQSSYEEVPDWRHSQVFYASRTERSFCCANAGERGQRNNIFPLQSRPIARDLRLRLNAGWSGDQIMKSTSPPWMWVAALYSVRAMRRPR